MVKEHAGDEFHIDIMELRREMVVSLGIVSSELRKPVEMKSDTPKPPPVSDTFTVDGHYPSSPRHFVRWKRALRRRGLPVR